MATNALDRTRLVDGWMSRSVHTVAPDDYLVDAFELMRLHRIRHLPVVESDRLVGIVSHRDLRCAMPLRDSSRGGDEAAYGEALFKTRVSRVMTTYPITVGPGHTVREAAEIICREKIGALPVVEDDRLVGIISAEDILWAFLDRTQSED